MTDSDSPNAPRAAKILATLGPASGSRDTIARMVAAGVDAFRLNMSHGTHEEHRRLIETVRDVEREAGRPVGILMDLCGPKIRVGNLVNGGPVHLETGATVCITDDAAPGTAESFSSTHPGWIGDVDPGCRVLLDDGQLELRVEKREGGALVTRVVLGGPLGERKGINLPDAALRIPSVTDRDREDIAFGVESGVDVFALSFVRRPEDVELAREAIRAAGSDAPIIAKIEKREAMEALDAILDAADGVLVARGDLGVETSFESVPILQKQILERSSEHGKVSITATQMLQSMMTNPKPTRAEASDIANAVLDGSDGLLLTGETAVGEHPVGVIETMDRIVRTAEESHLVHTRFGRPRENTGSYRRAIAEAAAFAAREMSLECIVVLTHSGTMARHVAALRPERRIVALTPFESTRRRLTMVWGVESYILDFPDSASEWTRRSDAVLLERGLAQEGADVIIMAGRIANVGLSTMMKIHRVGAGV